MNALAQLIVDRLSDRLGGSVEKYSATSINLAVKAAASETDASPTDAQKEAGNYRKGRFSWNGMSIAIENPAGSIRSGKSKSGHEWSIKMPIHYGYIARTESEADGDAVDVFVGPNPESEIVFVVDQQRGDGGQFDEHKVVIGYSTEQAAREAYLSCYSPGWKGLKSITPMTVGQFKAWLDEGSSGNPIAGQVSKYSKNRVASGQLGFGFKEDVGQKSFKWREELHPRDADGKFATADSRGEKSQDADELADDDKSIGELAGEFFAEDVGLSEATGEDASPPEMDSSLPVDSANDKDSDSTQSPRQEATEEVEQDAKSSTVYAYARESAIPNMGEDVLGSARHKRHQWKGLEDAEQNGTADELVTRENLLKNEPHGLAIYADKNPMVAMAMHYAMRAFPAKPGYKNGEVGHKEREQYIEVYRLIKSKAEQLAATEQDPRAAIKSLWHDLSAKVRELRGQTDHGSYGHLTATDKYNQTANAIVSMSSAFETYRSRPKANSIIGKTVAFVNEAAKAVPEISDKSLPLEQRAEAFNRVGTAAIAVMSGKSVPEAFGQKGTKAKGFSELAQYVSSAERKGGKDVSQHTSSGEKAAKHLGEAYGLRGVQWGNSLTDEERRHHAVKTVEAFTDLADVLGLKPEDVSLGGNVALGIGSRGKGGTSATYWPDKKFINLNRSSGVGSLAHEWGHAFDHSLADFEGEGMRFKDHSRSHSTANLSGDQRDYHPIMKGLKEAMEKSGYKDRITKELQQYVDKGLISEEKANKYWLDDSEMFARSFERHVQEKLASNGQSNTYLVGVRRAAGLWPTGEEVAQMAPHFDKLFATYRKKKYGSEEPQKFSRSQLAEAIRMALSGVAEKYRKQYDPNEEGHWVTIDGNHVFIKDATAGDHAKSMGQLHRVRSEHVQHLMPEAHRFLKDQIDQREIAKAHARKLSRLNSGSIAKIENNYRDWSSVDGFDAIARDVALAHPELGFDPDDTDTPGKVWDLIREGKQEYPSADSKEVAELAAKWLKSSTPAKRQEYPEDALEFSRERHGQSPEKYAFREEDHPRDEIGRFVDSAASSHVAARKTAKTVEDRRKSYESLVAKREAAGNDDDVSDEEQQAEDQLDVAEAEDEDNRIDAEIAESDAVSAADEAIDALDQEEPELAKELAVAKRNHKRLSGIAAKLREKADRLKQAAESGDGPVTPEVRAAISNHKKLAAVAAKKRDKADKLKGVVADLEQQKKEAEAQVESYSGQIDDLNKRQNAAIEKYVSVSRDPDTTDEDVDAAYAAMKQIEKEEDDLSRIVNPLVSAVEKLDDKIDKAKEVQQEAESDADEADESAAEAFAEIADAKRTAAMELFDEADVDADDAESEAEDARQELESLRAEHAKTIEQRDELKAMRARLPSMIAERIAVLLGGASLLQ